MGKYDLSASGVTALCTALYSRDDEELAAEASLLAEDPRAWIARNLELQVHQLEYLREMHETSIRILGWSLAATVIGRRPLNFTDMRDNEIGTGKGTVCLLYKVLLSGHYAAGKSMVTGTFELTCAENRRV